MLGGCWLLIGTRRIARPGAGPDRKRRRCVLHPGGTQRHLLQPGGGPVAAGHRRSGTAPDLAGGRSISRRSCGARHGVRDDRLSRHVRAKPGPSTTILRGARTGGSPQFVVASNRTGIGAFDSSPSAAIPAIAGSPSRFLSDSPRLLEAVARAKTRILSLPPPAVAPSYETDGFCGRARACQPPIDGAGCGYLLIGAAESLIKRR